MIKISPLLVISTQNCILGDLSCHTFQLFYYQNCSEKEIRFGVLVIHLHLVISELYAIPKSFSWQVMAGGAFDMSKYLYEGKILFFWRTVGHDGAVFKQPGQKGHFTLWKCHFCYLDFKTGFKQSPLKNFLCWKKKI